jgi:DNA-binding transcriptional LysR family regulator
MNSLSSIDMNLLIALDSLLAEGNVTAAARRHGVTQSAMSHNLARLRDLFDDRLLVRVGARMKPTPRAQQLQPALRAALLQVEGVLAGRPSFDAATADMVFNVASTDYGAAFVAPLLLAHLERQAPRVRIAVKPLVHRDLVGQLASGDIQLAAGLPFDDLPGTVTQLLFEERFASLVRPGHPLLDKPGDLEAFVAAPHCLVSPFSRNYRSVVDEALAAIGLQRRVQLELPFFLAAPQVIASSDLVLTAPSKLAEMFVATHGLVMFEPPLSLPSVAIQQVWHERYTDEPSVKWLRNTVAHVVQELHDMALHDRVAGRWPAPCCD